jgi:hypothetical protein
MRRRVGSAIASSTAMSDMVVIIRVDVYTCKRMHRRAVPHACAWRGLSERVRDLLDPRG